MAAFNYRGAWTPNTAYAADDAYTEAGSTYGVTSAYTSGTAFSSTDTSHSSVIAQAGAQGPAGPAGTVTATGVNGGFDVPGLLTNAGGYRSISTRSTASGYQPLQLGAEQFVSSPTFTGSGHSLGNPGGWTVQKTLLLEPTNLQRGIGQVINFAEKKYAVGDHAGVYGYVRGVAGVTALSDEGNTGTSMHITELTDLLRGYVTQNAEGSTTLSLASNDNYYTHPVDGGMLLNVTRGAITGNLNGASTQLDNTYLNRLPVADITLPDVPPTVGAKLPQTEAWGIATQAIPTRNCSADSPVLTEVHVILQKIVVNGQDTYPRFEAGKVVSVAGVNYPEQALIATASAAADETDPRNQTLGIYLRNPNAQAILFQGGVAGHYISFDANKLFSGVRSSYYAFGSLDGTDLIYGVNRGGNLAGNYLPVPEVEAARNTGDGAGFHLFPGAEVVKGPSSNQSLDITLEANNVVWKVDDQVEATAGAYFAGSGILMLWDSQSPSTPSQPSVGITLIAKGKSISSGYINQSWINDNPYSNYQPFGGPLRPPMLTSVSGVWQDWFRSYTAPLGNLFKFLSFANPAQNVYSLFDFNVASSEFAYRKDTSEYVCGKFRTTYLLAEEQLTAGRLKVTNDVEFGASGVVMPDTATGARMRIQVTNGALVVSAA